MRKSNRYRKYPNSPATSIAQCYPGDAAISGGYEVLILNNPPNVTTLRDGLIRTDPTSLTDSYRTTLLGPLLTFIHLYYALTIHHNCSPFFYFL
ncbi:MAG TPA: hypothetical protein VF047_08170 [Nitrososphaeraceae archaeon]